MPHCLMACSTAAALHYIRIFSTGKYSWNPVADLYPRIGRFAHLGVYPQDMEYLRPEPFGRINSTFILSIVYPTPSLSQMVDLICLLYGSMILPQDKHRVGVLFKLVQ